MFLSAHPQATGNMTMPMITIDGGTLSYDVSGAGPPIVFVAGLGEHGTYWMAQVAAFSSAFQVVTFDHGGVGASEGQPPYKVEQWAADTLRLSITWVSAGCIWSDIRPAVPLRRC
jgi:pimeloyl-ACP methyl ester carboxylesterase